MSSSEQPGALGTSAKRSYDVVVVGSGAGGMVAALTCQHLGLDVLVVEKASRFGGSSAWSGGNLWIPNNHVNVRAGVVDSLEEARTYLDEIVGGTSAVERREAFLRAGPDALAFLEKHTRWVRYQRVPGYPDYHPETPGGRPEGRSIEPVPVDLKALGEDAERLNDDAVGAPAGLWLTTAEYHDLMLVARTWRGKRETVRIALRSWWGRLRGRRMVALGAAGIIRLRLAMRDAEIPLRLNSPLLDLDVRDGRVAGVVIGSGEGAETIEARRGVVLAAGGFEHNAEMRARYQEQPITTEWTSGVPENTGDAIRIGVEHGGTTALMDRAWWGPTLLINGVGNFILSERSLPGSIMVNSAGQRFGNESAPYVNAVDAMYAGERSGVPHIPAFLIFDQRFRNRYAMIAAPPRRRLPKEWTRDGSLVRAETIADLAGQLGLDPAALAGSIERFNAQARSGRDEDFGRGDSVYDRYYGDPTVRPNPNLAPISAPPFYAFRVVPGDLGTNGGLVCDHLGRVLDRSQAPIAGLYATGNCTAAVMGNEYAGPGATLGPAVTFAFVSAQHLADPEYDPIKVSLAGT